MKFMWMTEMNISSHSSRPQGRRLNSIVRCLMDKLKLDINEIFEKAAKGGYSTLLGGSQRWNEMHKDVTEAVERHLTGNFTKAKFTPPRYDKTFVRGREWIDNLD